MKQALASLACVMAMAGSASAACYADYKAKQDNPLRLHYGVAQISACSRAGAEAELAGRLTAQGWTLLQVVAVFDDTGLSERQDRAGPYFLRF